MRAAYDALSGEMKMRLNGLIGEHSLIYSRAKLGFTDFTERPSRIVRLPRL
jgi:alpha-ketoglutarate-dependent 2,4-dichlorophenoxyacetate dioxygenase